MPGSNASGKELTLKSYTNSWMEKFMCEPNYCGYGIYRTGKVGAEDKAKLEEQGITHVLSLGKENFILKENKSDKIKYYEKHIRDKNVNHGEDGDEGGWEGFWKDKKVVKFIESAMPDAAHPNRRLVVHCKHGQYRTGFVVRGIMIKYKAHSLMQAYRRVDFNTTLIRDFPNAVEVLRSLPDDEKKWTSDDGLCELRAKFLDWPAPYNHTQCIFGHDLASGDDELPSVSFEGCPEDPYEQDEKVKKAIQKRLELQKRMPCDEEY